MKTHEFRRDERGVPPVVGVILLVAIAVILSSVVAVFALGIGDQSQTTPTASFTFDYDQAASNLTITHGSGANIVAADVYVRGTSGTGGEALGHAWDSSNWNYSAGTANADRGGNPAIASGDSLVVDVGSNYDVSVVWQSPDSETSATLGEDEGPDA